jgi:transcriptional regulator with XRE-family HTH domain
MTEGLKRAIGTRVITARRRAGLSQEALAAKIRRTPESISNIERGQQLPAIDTLIELATVLQVPLPDFFRSFNDQRKLSRERAENEAKIEETVRSLSDTAVAIAADQIRALIKVR